MRCCEIEVLWDEIRGDCTASLKQAVVAHLEACPPCQELYEQYEGVAYRLSNLPKPEPSCNLSARVLQHIAHLRNKFRSTPVTLAHAPTPIGRVYVGLREDRIVYLGIDTGQSLERVREHVEARLRRPVIVGDAPAWLHDTLDAYFATWQIDDQRVDLSDLTPFEQAALRATATIPPGEVRSYGWVATTIGRPKAARAVGRVMARNPLPLLFPCHRVVDSTGDLHDYGYGLDLKARLLQMEGYRPPG
ncbi:MAG: methylated-DNA--[protein]-cysteine S-methyltransferase [Vulcanimicrobiaceae bacterium]